MIKRKKSGCRILTTALLVICLTVFCSCGSSGGDTFTGGSSDETKNFSLDDIFSFIGSEEDFSYDITPYNDPETYPYFANLDDAEKQAYAEVMQYAEQGIKTYDPKADYNEEQLGAAVSAVYLDQPQLFWLENTPESGYVNSSTGLVVSVTLGYNELADNLQTNIAAFNEATQEALSGLDGLTDAEKERAIHDYLAEHITYQLNSLDQNAYGALVNGSCVCNGYAQAFQYLLKCEGLKAYFVGGQACGNGTWDNHAWNIVKLGDSYYNVDPTWDDTDGSGTNYTYYNVTDDEISADHARNEISAFLPACTGTEYSFEALYGMTGDEAFARAAAEQLGLTDQAIIESAAQFDETIANALIGAGAGSYTICYLIHGDACIQEIEQILSDQNAAEDNFMTAVTGALGMSSYSWSMDVGVTQLSGSWYYLTMNVSLN